MTPSLSLLASYRLSEEDAERATSCSYNYPEQLKLTLFNVLASHYVNSYVENKPSLRQRVTCSSKHKRWCLKYSLTRKCKWLKSMLRGRDFRFFLFCLETNFDCHMDVEVQRAIQSRKNSGKISAIFKSRETQPNFRSLSSQYYMFLSQQIRLYTIHVKPFLPEDHLRKIRLNMHQGRTENNKQNENDNQNVAQQI